MADEYRIERDSLGEIRVPAEACWGAQTQRAIENFPISGIAMPREFIEALGLIKGAAAHVNASLGLLDDVVAGAIQIASGEVADGQHDTQFPIDVFQTGSGTSSNMNANEVIAHLASRRSGIEVHPNDHVNMCQSSNDVIPTAIHVSVALTLRRKLLPAMNHLADSLLRRANDFDHITKTGRTHLMDAMPVRLGQEIGGWAAQVRDATARLESTMPRLQLLAQGGTAVGTGINAHPEFGYRVARALADKTGVRFERSPNYFASMSSQDTIVEVSGQLRGLAVTLMKIANDLRWMNSGPLAGLAEIKLPALQPGSSIMPGKVNPVIPEAVAMACAHMIGNDAAVAVAGQSGNFQLNVMLPVIAHNVLESMRIGANAARALADNAIAGFEVNTDAINAALARNPILVTALNPVIGYELGARIAKKAYAEGRAVLDVATELTDLDEATLKKLLNPRDITRGGIIQGPDKEKAS